MRQTCSILRPAYGALDPFGQPTVTLMAHKADVPCRLMPTQGREIQTISKDMVISNHELFMRHFNDVGDDPREYDVIQNIIESDGTIRDENVGDFDIVLVNHRGEYGKEHHLELALVRRKGPP